MTTRAETILNHLNGRRSAMLDRLEELVLAESPSTDPEANKRTRALLADAFHTQGYRVLTPAGRSSGGQLYAVPRDRERGKPSQLLVGHFDTVWPLGTLNTMPFQVEGNVVRGPGAFDMKGGLVQILFALESLRDLGLDPGLTPVVFLNADEEIGSRESRRYITMLAKRCERAMVLEPALGVNGKIKTARKGIARYTVTVHGKAAHAGLDPHSGISAILEMSHVIQTLFGWNDVERGVTVNVGTVDGGLRPNVVAPTSVAVVDVRVAHQDDADRIHESFMNLESATEGVSVDVEGGFGRPPMERTPRNREFWMTARRLGSELGLELEQATAGGGSDGNTTSLYTATLDGLGPVGDGAHARHEFLYIDKTIERTALLCLLLLAPPINGQSG